MDEQTDKVIPSSATMSDSNPDQETAVVMNALTGLDSLLSTRTAHTDVLNVFYVLSKDVWRTKRMLWSFSIIMFWHGIILATLTTWKETSTLTSLFLMDIIMDYVLSCCSANTYGLEKVVRVIYVPHKDVWTMAMPPYWWSTAFFPQMLTDHDEDI